MLVSLDRCKGPLASCGWSKNHGFFLGLLEGCRESLSSACPTQDLAGSRFSTRGVWNRKRSPCYCHSTRWENGPRKSVGSKVCLVLSSTPACQSHREGSICMMCLVGTHHRICNALCDFDFLLCQTGYVQRTEARSPCSCTPVSVCGWLAIRSAYPPVKFQVLTSPLSWPGQGSTFNH